MVVYKYASFSNWMNESMDSGNHIKIFTLHQINIHYVVMQFTLKPSITFCSNMNIFFEWEIFQYNDAEISIYLLLWYSSDSWYSRFYEISFNARQTKNPSTSKRFTITRNFNNDILCHEKLIFHNHKLLKLALRMLIVPYEYF